VYDIRGNLVKPQVTKKDGRYLFSLLPPGKYEVAIAYPKGFVPTTKNRPYRGRNSSTLKSQSVNLSAGASDLSLDFGMVKRGDGGSPNTLPVTL
jgi:hypothetical protein